MTELERATWERIYDEVALSGYDVTSQRGEPVTMTPDSWLRLLSAGRSRQEG